MGFLNHSTNNIIIDAVLTERGREVLSRNDGTFSIESFSFGDDEIDYGIIKKYGLAIGQEKIEKNTPIFEAVTNEKLALKYPLRSFVTNNTEDIFAVPYLVLDSTIVTPVSLTSNINSNREIEKSIVVKTFVDQDEGFVLSEESLIDSSFTIKVFDKLLRLTGSNSKVVKNETAYYTVAGSSISEDFTGQRSCRFTVTSRDVVDAATFKYYSTKSNNSLIKTQIEIIGNNTNSSLLIPVTIQNNIYA